MLPSEHNAWNRTHYPGTRQMCEVCGGETERCEDDALFDEDENGPMCESCYDKSKVKP